MVKKVYFKSNSIFFKHNKLIFSRVVNIAQEKNWVQSGDFVVVTFGDVEGVSGKTNSLKIIKV